VIKVTHGSSTFHLAFGSEAELSWESLWFQVAGRFELLPGGGTVASAIYAGAAVFTYVDSDGDTVQLVCQDDLAIAVRSASLLSPPTLRLMVGLGRSGGGDSASETGGSGGGGDGGAGGSGRRAPERYGGRPQPGLPGPQPQGDGRTSLSGGGGAAGERSVRRYRRPNGAAPASACPQEPQWARAEAQVLAERGYRRFTRPASAARPSASTERFTPMVPSAPQTLPQAVQMSPPPAREGRLRGQRTVRLHERRRRGERWCRRSMMAPHSGGERVGSCSGEALLRHARQPYGEGPGRSRSGPISIRS
jgi:hypothetical protein